MLRCFRHGVNALGNLDLARLTGLPKPTISRITYTLTELGYLRYHPDTGKYSPGYGVLALGCACWRAWKCASWPRPR